MKLPGVKRVISAGAAVPIDTIRRMQRALDDDAEVHTPYGATECLPVASISGRQIDAEIERDTLSGKGICVGQAIAPNRVAVIGISDQPRERLAPADTLETGQRGEIIVHGPTTTDAYWRRAEQTRLAKMTDDEGRVWHRMGDIGYLDERGRLWYCGRKSQRVTPGGEALFPDQVEAVFNAHPDVARTALVGVGQPGEQRPVLVVELEQRGSRRRRQRVRDELLETAATRPGLDTVRTVLFHRDLPVDIRHNAKLNREALSAWAEGRLA